MTAIYGDSLLSSPELMETIQVFQQAPLVGGGYGPKSDPIPFRVIKWDEGSRIKGQDGTWVKIASRTLWSRKQIPDASFFDKLGTVWRIMTDQAWKQQAGFYIHGLEKVVGLNGNPSTAPEVNLGGGSF